VLSSAVGAVIDDGSELAGAAGADGAERLSVSQRHGDAEAPQILRAVAADHLGERGHGPTRGGLSKLLHPLLDRIDRVLLPLGSEVQIDRGGLQRATAEVFPKWVASCRTERRYDEEGCGESAAGTSRPQAGHLDEDLLRSAGPLVEGDPWCQNFRKQWCQIFRNPHHRKFAPQSLVGRLVANAGGELGLSTVG
jgi:hypothetical protein